jgi:hypothetical protein
MCAIPNFPYMAHMAQKGLKMSEHWFEGEGIDAMEGDMGKFFYGQAKTVEMARKLIETPLDGENWQELSPVVLMYKDGEFQMPLLIKPMIDGSSEKNGSDIAVDWLKKKLTERQPDGYVLILEGWGMKIPTGDEELREQRLLDYKMAKYRIKDMKAKTEVAMCMGVYRIRHDPSSLTHRVQKEMGRDYVAVIHYHAPIIRYDKAQRICGEWQSVNTGAESKFFIKEW